MSYDVSALFTSVPVDKGLEIIRKRLQDYITLPNRTPLSPDDVIAVLEKFLKGTYFLYKGEHYFQIQGAAMGSPFSPIVYNIHMEDFEQRVLAEANDPPRWWKRYLDDTYTVLKKDQAETFKEYLNMIDDNIKRMTDRQVHQEVEVKDMEKKVERCLTFLDTVSDQRRWYYSYKRVQEGEHNNNRPLEHK